MNNPTIIDVRTPAEFMGGHVQGSINIPLQEVPARIAEIKSMSQPIVLCCASGVRSEKAMLFLRQHGIECSNCGGWLDVNGKF